MTTKLKLCFLILIFFLMFSELSIAKGEENRPKFSFHFYNTPLRDALKKVSIKFNVQFIYNDALVDGKTVTCDFSAASVDSALYRLLSDYGVDFKAIQSTKIVLYKTSNRTIRGYVLDGENGEPLPFANILLKGKNLGTATDLNGYFALATPSEPCTLHVSYIGYRPGEVIADVPAGSDFVNIPMEPQPVPAPDVCITAAREPIVQLSPKTGAIQFEPEQVRTLPSIGATDIKRTLQRLPGISALDDGFYVRGGTTGNNLVLYDDIPIYQPNHFFGFFAAFNPEAVEQVQLLRGGAPATFGDHTFSVLNIASRKPDPERVRLTAGISTLATDAWINLPLMRNLVGTFSYRHSLLNIDENALIKKIYHYQTGAPKMLSPWSSASYNFYDLTANLHFVPDKDDTVRASLLAAEDQSDNSHIWYTPSHQDTYSNYTRWQNVGWSLSWRHRVNEKYFTKLALYYTNYRSSFFRNHVSGSEAYRFVYLPELSSDLSIENSVKDGGLRWDHFLMISSKHRANFGLAISSRKLTLGSLRGAMWMTSNAPGKVAEFYLQDTWKPLRPIRVLAGFRTSWTLKERGMAWHNIDPRLTAIFALSKRFQIRGHYGQHRQFVNGVNNSIYIKQDAFTNLLAGNDLLWRMPRDASIDCIQKSIGIKYETADILFDVEAYRYELQYRVKWQNPAFVLRDINYEYGDQPWPPDRSPSNGVDALLQKKRGRFTGWIGYSYGKATQMLIKDGSWIEVPADYDLRHQFKLVANYKRNTWAFSLAWTWTSGRPYTAAEYFFDLQMPDGETKTFIEPGPVNGSNLPAFHHLDLSLTRYFQAKHFDWEINFSVYNAYDRHNVWYRLYLFQSYGAGNRVQDAFIPSFNPNISLRIKLK